MTLADRTLVRFAELVGAAPDFAVRAPGRVNLIGEHTDYNDGFVLPAAIALQSIVAVRRRPDSIVRMIAADFGDAAVAGLYRRGQETPGRGYRHDHSELQERIAQ